MKSFIYLTLAFIGTAMIAKPAAADYQQELKQLREDVQILQRQVYRSGGKKEQTADTDTSVIQGKIGEYDEAIRKLNGRLDELENSIRQNDNKLDKISRDMEIRFKILEGRQVPAELSAPAPQIAPTYNAPVARHAAASVVGDSIQGEDLAPIDDGSPQPLFPGIEKDQVTTTQPVATTSASPKEMYNNAMQAFNSGLYDEAEIGFEDIIKQFPKHNLASSAQYWLGEVYTKQGDLNKAKAAFKDGYEKYKSGNKAADSLFKLGYTFNKSGDRNRACIVYMSFADEFPKAPAELSTRVKAEIKKLGCK